MATPATNFALPNSQPDVQIYIQTQTFILHSHILKLRSRWFAASMSETWWKPETQSPFRYSYRLDYDSDGISTLLPLKEKDSINTTPPEANPTNPTPHPDPSLSTTFENLFKSFYQKLLHNLTPKQCTALISLADQYDALHSVSHSIRANLLEWENLDDHIEKTPLEFLFISYKLQWARAFKESFIHTVGIHCGKLGIPATSLWADSNFSMPDSIALLVQSECDRINQLLFAAMREFLRFSGDETGPFHWFCFQTIRNEIRRCFALYGNPGQEGSLFREIAESRFIPREEDIQHYKKVQPRPYDSVIQLAAEGIKTLASGLSKNNLSSKRNTPHLTCAEAKLPWLE